MQPVIIENGQRHEQVKYYLFLSMYSARLVYRKNIARVTYRYNITYKYNTHECLYICGDTFLSKHKKCAHTRQDRYIYIRNMKIIFFFCIVCGPQSPIYFAPPKYVFFSI